MIGYYVHHRGSGHLHRALSVAAALGAPVTILSSLARPSDWTGGWVHLPLDTDVDPVEATAGGDFHWVPLDSVGLGSRMSTISRWIAVARPSAVVVDISVEVCALVRLHGVRVVTFAQPGERLDPAHALGYRMSSAIIAPWTADLHPSLVSADVESRFRHVGAISRIAVLTGPRLTRRPNLVAVMNGSGGRGASALDCVVEEARATVPDAEWLRLEGESADTVERTLREAALVFTHCGQNAVAEVAACRTPAVLVAEERPHDEQLSYARALAPSGLPAVICSPTDGGDRAEQVARATALDGNGWSRLVDGSAAERAAAVIRSVAQDARVLAEWTAA